ncbi:MAG: DNA ligase-associated DEXH box helicase, partial [Bacteroidetes bacterium]|nr:DNA ligase-associated DEXH box helicase [Bacteroidota bacterium]
NVSGWALVRGMRRRQNLDNGFALSDHADWPGLLSAIKGTGAEHIYCTHGFTSEFSRYLSEQGYNSTEIHTRFLGDAASEPTITPETDESIY